MHHWIDKIKAITEDQIRFSKFRLVDVEHKQFKSKHTFTVFVDSTSGITIDECRLLSNRIQEAMESSGEFDVSYVLEVSSPGLDRPLLHHWQYEKNIQRLLEITYLDDEGKEIIRTVRLWSVQESEIIVREEKPKKKQSDEAILIPFDKIRKARVQIEWNK